MTNENQPNEAMDIQPDDPSITQPQAPVDLEPQDVAQTQPQKVVKRSPGGFWLSLLILVVALGLGAFAGYDRGVSERVSAQGTLVASQLGAQFTLVQQDIDAKRFDVARQRLEFIIGQDAKFPGAAEKLAEVLVQQAITPSPVPTETPTLTPTPDLRSQEAIFAQAQQLMTNKDWTGVLGALDSLRKADPTFKSAIVDGMYYNALRNRGVDKILGTGSSSKTSNLEGGIYDLTLAERFGPLDGYSDGLRNFARQYISGASFWDVNWPQAVNIFRTVYQNTPNLRDSSNVTAGQRLYQALLNYGDGIVAAGGRLKDKCLALDAWDEARNITALDGAYATKYNQLYLECFPPTAVPSAVPPAATSEPAATAGATSPAEPPTATPAGG